MAEPDPADDSAGDVATDPATGAVGDGDALVDGAEAVLFDMDGVIVDSEAYWLTFEDEVLFPSVLAEPYPDNEEITGMNFREIYDYLDANYEVTATREAFIEHYEEVARDIYGEDVALMPGFRDLTGSLRERDLNLGVVSSSPPDWIGRVVDRFDLGPFDVIRSADAIEGPGKPEPDVYEHAAADLDVAAADCVVVEDSATGSLAAERAGMVVVGYRTETNAEADLPAADVVVDGPEALRAALLGEK